MAISLSPDFLSPDFSGNYLSDFAAISQFKQQAGQAWQAYTQHEFVAQLANGSLPIAAFQHYLKQDYRFLFQYSRALSLGIYKAQNFNQIRQAQQASLQAIFTQATQLEAAFWQMGLDLSF